MFKKIIVIFFLITVSSIAAFIMAEIIIRFFIPQTLATQIYTSSQEGLSYSLKPNSEGWLKSKEFGSVRIIINSKGIREDEVPYENYSGAYRILILGDSTTFGWGINKQDRFSDALEAGLNSSGFRSVKYPEAEVINCGVGGYGTADKFKFFNIEGSKYRPNMVILVGGDEMEDIITSNLYRVENDRLRSLPGLWQSLEQYRRFTRFIPFYNYLCNNSHVVNFLRINFTKAKIVNMKTNVLKDKLKTEGAQKVQYYLFKELKKICDAKGAKLLLCAIYFPKPDSRDEIKSIAKELRIDFIDFYGIFNPEDSFIIDGHLNKNGHRKIAKKILDYLIANKKDLLE